MNQTDHAGTPRPGAPEPPSEITSSPTTASDTAHVGLTTELVQVQLMVGHSGNVPAVHRRGGRSCGGIGLSGLIRTGGLHEETPGEARLLDPKYPTVVANPAIGNSGKPSVS